MNILEQVKKAAHEGDGVSQFLLGVLYLEGKEVEQDPREAFTWFTRSAARGCAYAHFNLGVMYFEGKVIEQNIECALFHLESAVELGHVEGALAAAGIYYTVDKIKSEQLIIML